MYKKHLPDTEQRHPEAGSFFFLVTLVMGPRKSLSLTLSDTRVYEL